MRSNAVGGGLYFRLGVGGCNYDASTIQFILISVHKDFCMFRAPFASKFSKSASITLKFPRPSPPQKKKSNLGSKTEVYAGFQKH
jgi:hypothetical protein